MFEVNVELASLAAPERTEKVSLLVDTGATLSWIPRDILERLGVAPVSRLPFTLADGRRLERDTTAVALTVDGRKLPCPWPLGNQARKRFWGPPRLRF
jgi:predicted aspartyl protease